MPSCRRSENFNIKIFSPFVLVTKINNTKNYSQQNLDQPKTFYTVISMCPSSSCHVQGPSLRFYSQERPSKPTSK